MKKLIGFGVFFLVSAHFFQPLSVYAQTLKPAIVLTPSSSVVVGSRKAIQLSMVNMGIPLRRVEIAVRYAGNKDEIMGLSFEHLNTEQYGLAYKSHYFRKLNDSSEELMVVFEAMNPNGYNQGSGQIPLVNVTYTVTPGEYTATIVTDTTKMIDNEGNLLNYDTFGTRVYKTEQVNGSGISSYSLSFESDPIRKWWPTAPNSVQQIDAAIWKDADGDNVKKFTNISTDWQVDSNYFEIKNTTSSYFDKCPVANVGGRPCIRFAAHVVTKKPGKSTIMLKVTDELSKEVTWNSYPVEIYSLENQTPTPVNPSIYPSPYPTPIFIPETKVTDKEFEEVKQKVTYLQTQLENQQKQISGTQRLLDRITNFLKRLFGFK